jgi:hypothetical protein
VLPKKSSSSTEELNFSSRLFHLKKEDPAFRNVSPRRTKKPTSSSPSLSQMSPKAEVSQVIDKRIPKEAL